MEDEWHPIPVPGGSHFVDAILETNIKDAVVPPGLHVLSNFITEEDTQRVLDIMKQHNHLWKYRGFQERRRVQTHRIDDSSSSPSSSPLDWIVDKLMAAMEELPLPSSKDRQNSFQRPNEIIIEERKPTNFAPLRCNRFESMTQNTSNDCICCNINEKEQEEAIRLVVDNSCSCFVAELALHAPVVQSIDRPRERKAECWDLSSLQHGYSFLMPPTTLFVKTGESVWNWRSRMYIPMPAESITGEKESSNNTSSSSTMMSPTYTIKFRQVVRKMTDKCYIEEEEEKKEESEECLSSEVQQSSVEEENKGGDDKLLSKELTIIVTTSPIKSNPSTELLERTFATFHHGGQEFLSCEKIIVCDGCRILEDEKKEMEEVSNKPNKVSKKYQNAKQALRNGIATNTQAENYRLFKIALTKLCEDAKGDVSSPFFNTRVVELHERWGYGFALRYALYNEVSTPYVCVVQHDRTFMRSTPIKAIVKAMMNKRVNGDIKYVGISMRSNLNYRDIFTSKYGKDALNELLEMVILPPELVLDSERFGPNQSMINKIVCDNNLKRNLESFAQSYLSGSIQYRSHRNQLEEGRVQVKENNQKCQLSLTPTLFWYDNTHICETAHYRDFIFHPKYKMVARGGFVEDKLSPVITKSVERLGLREGHSKFNCYLVDDHSGFFFTGHLDGGSFMTDHEKQLLIKRNK